MRGRVFIQAGGRPRRAIAVRVSSGRVYFATIAPPRKAFAKGVISAANITHARVRVRATSQSGGERDLSPAAPKEGGAECLNQDGHAIGKRRDGR